MRIVLTQPRRRTGDGAADLCAIAELVAASSIELCADDILVLPELIGGEATRPDYVDALSWLAQTVGAHVVGGSHLYRHGGHAINRGLVVDPTGAEIAWYEKANPYGSERAALGRGKGGARFAVGSVQVLVLICADFWYPQAFDGSGAAPDIVIVPAFSVSRQPAPHLARARWRHAAVARAYDLPAFVAASDWAHPVALVDGRSSGAAGLAHPNPASARKLFQSLGRHGVMAFDIDLEALDDLRADRKDRGFLIGERP
jgi:predicted amidohydrolase